MIPLFPPLGFYSLGAAGAISWLWLHGWKPWLKNHPEAGVHPPSPAFLLAPAPSKLRQKKKNPFSPVFNPAGTQCRTPAKPRNHQTDTVSSSAF